LLERTKRRIAAIMRINMNGELGPSRSGMDNGMTTMTRTHHARTTTTTKANAARKCPSGIGCETTDLTELLTTELLTISEVLLQLASR
jgi:hypothetical protein